MKAFSETERELDKFAEGVVKAAKMNLQKSKASGGLSDSVRYELKTTKQKGGFISSFRLQFYFDEYGEYQDKGVDGTKKKHGSPYKYTNKRPPASAFSKWVVMKGLDGVRNKKGQFIKRKSMQFAIATSVYRNGIKPTRWFTKAFDSKYKKLDKVQKAFALDYEKFLASTLQENGNN